MSTLDSVLDMVLLSDPVILNLPVLECGEPRIDLRTLDALRLDERLADEAGRCVRVVSRRPGCARAASTAACSAAGLAFSHSR